MTLLRILIASCLLASIAACRDYHAEYIESCLQSPQRDRFECEHMWQVERATKDTASWGMLNFFFGGK